MSYIALTAPQNLAELQPLTVGAQEAEKLAAAGPETQENGLVFDDGEAFAFQQGAGGVNVENTAGK